MRLKGTALVLVILALLPIQTLPSFASQSRTYPSKIDGYAAPDSATLAVRFHVYNNGVKPVSPSCTITAQDSSGTYHGFDIFVLKNVAAGSTANGLGNIVITHQGANFVTQVKIICTAETTDTQTIQGSIKVLRVDPPTTDGFAGHDSSGWFWGGIPQVQGVPDNTQVKCTVKALDEKGNLLTSYTFNGSVYQGGVSGPGTQNTTSLIGPKIKNASAACQLGSGDTKVPVPDSSSTSLPANTANSNWIPDGYEEDSAGFGWKWLDNAVNCTSGKNYACWNGDLIVKNGCPYGVKITVGLFADGAKKEGANFSQSFLAKIAPMQNVKLALSNPAVKNLPNGQIDSEVCLGQIKGKSYSSPPVGTIINSTYNNIGVPSGSKPVGSNFLLGVKKISCPKGSVLCFTVDTINTMYCPKGYIMNGFIGAPGAASGWATDDVNAGTDSKTGVEGGYENKFEIDLSVANLVSLSHLTTAAVQAQLKSDNELIFSTLKCLS
jgi:hypothetical protein